MIKGIKTENMNPNAVRIWERFAELAAIPRPSKGEAKAADYLVKFAEDRGFSSERDSENNVLITISPTRDREGSLGIILQCHSDMVCVSNGDRDPSKEGVEPMVDGSGEWITAKDTTLGADNGIGVATFLALLEDKEFQHGPLAVLITTDEETGLNGASHLSFDFSNYKYMINGDSEDWGEVTIGCAGGEDFITTLSLAKEEINPAFKFVKIEVSGLAGGHSALAIATVGHANAIKLLGGILSDVGEHVGVQIVSISGGTARNVIPSRAEVVFAYLPGDGGDVETLVQQTIERYIKEFTHESGLTVNISSAETSSDIFSVKDTERILALICDIPHGVYLWADGAETIPKTSTNLATIETNGDDVIVVSMSRSSVETELDNLQQKLDVAAKENGATAAREGKYPGWEPIENSLLVTKIKEVYKDMFGEELEITQTHGGLECGIILGKYPDLEVISFGPIIEGAHSTKEKVKISSVEKFYDLTKGLVKVISKEKIQQDSTKRMN